MDIDDQLGLFELELQACHFSLELLETLGRLRLRLWTALLPKLARLELLPPLAKMKE